MARLKKPPRASDEAAILFRSSNASNSGHASSDNEPATEQLISESHSSDILPRPSSRTPPPPPPAVLGAQLLNAARIDRNQTDHTSGTTGHKNRVGKLKRTTLIPQSSKTNLATRGDIYDIEVSPVKSNYTLPEKVNKMPLNIRKKKKKADREPRADLPEVDTESATTATVESAQGARSPRAENQQVAQEVKPSEKRKSASVLEEDQPAKLPRRREPAAHEPISTVTSQNPRPSRHSSSSLKGANDQTDAEGSESNNSHNGPTAPVVERAASMETVFKFLNIEERSGSCMTKSAKLIIRRCDKFCAKFQDEAVSKDTALRDATEIQEEMLKSLNGIVSKRLQSEFKSDAYGYVFHSLAVYLRALHDWLLKTYGSVTESLEALRTVTSLINAILIFKDRIAQWSVTVPQRYKGDRLIKDVDTYLIAPLRQVEKAFSARLSRLEEVERRRNHGLELRRKIEEQNEVEGAGIEAIKAIQERKKRWQDLHIVRMQCEPDIYRRRKLFHTRFEDLIERDANGIVFERLPLFKSRSAPPHSLISEIADEIEWTEREETAVLEGLEQCAGPYVFEKIFKTYCDPRSPHPRGGDLRNRSVAEIISKARWIRSAMHVLCQETGEPVEQWVTKIPVLP